MTIFGRPRHGDDGSSLTMSPLYAAPITVGGAVLRIRTRKPEHFTACAESRVNQSGGGGENNTRSLELIVLYGIYIYIYEAAAAADICVP